MAVTAAAAKMTEAHRLAQIGLGAQLVAQLRSSWPLLDPDDINGSFERWLHVVVPLVQANRTKSTATAARYLAVFRSLELGFAAGPFRPTVAPPADPKAVTTSLLVTGPYSVTSALARGVKVDQAMDVAQARSAAAAMRHALGGGRDTITHTVAADPRALGWARVASGKACAFCAMLASRGPVYSEQSVLGFETHDGCNCGAEPVYSSSAAWPRGSERYRELWDEHTAEHSGGDALNAFRRALTRT